MTPYLFVGRNIRRAALRQMGKLKLAANLLVDLGIREKEVILCNLFQLANLSRSIWHCEAAGCINLTLCHIH